MQQQMTNVGKIINQFMDEIRLNILPITENPYKNYLSFSSAIGFIDQIKDVSLYSALAHFSPNLFP